MACFFAGGRDRLGCGQAGSFLGGGTVLAVDGQVRFFDGRGYVAKMRHFSGILAAVLKKPVMDL